jgi:hypothetical protein
VIAPKLRFADLYVRLQRIDGLERGTIRKVHGPVELTVPVTLTLQ